MTDSSDELVGVIAVELTGQGSKSEMTSVVLYPDVKAPPIPLRRRDATVLSAEPELSQYVGRRVRVTGAQGWSTFVVDSVELLGEAGEIDRITDPAQDAD